MVVLVVVIVDAVVVVVVVVFIAVVIMVVVFGVVAFVLVLLSLILSLSNAPFPYLTLYVDILYITPLPEIEWKSCYDSTELYY